MSVSRKSINRVIDLLWELVLGRRIVAYSHGATFESSSPVKFLIVLVGTCCIILSLVGLVIGAKDLSLYEDFLNQATINLSVIIFGVIVISEVSFQLQKLIISLRKSSKITSLTIGILFYVGGFCTFLYSDGVSLAFFLLLGFPLSIGMHYIMRELHDGFARIFLAVFVGLPLIIALKWVLTILFSGFIPAFNNPSWAGAFYLLPFFILLSWVLSLFVWLIPKQGDDKSLLPPIGGKSPNIFDLARNQIIRRAALIAGLSASATLFSLTLAPFTPTAMDLEVIWGIVITKGLFDLGVVLTAMRYTIKHSTPFRKTMLVNKRDLVGLPSFPHLIRAVATGVHRPLLRETNSLGPSLPQYPKIWYDILVEYQLRLIENYGRDIFDHKAWSNVRPDLYKEKLYIRLHELRSLLREEWYVRSIKLLILKLIGIFTLGILLLLPFSLFLSLIIILGHQWSLSTIISLAAANFLPFLWISIWFLFLLCSPFVKPPLTTLAAIIEKEQPSAEPVPK